MPARIEANEYGLKIDDTTIYWDSITRTEVDPTKVDNPAYKAWQDLPREPQKPDKAKDLDLEYSRMLRNRSDAIKQRDKAEKTDQWIKSLPEKHPIIYKTEKNPRFYSTFGWVLFLGFICFVAALGIQKNPDHPDTGFAVLVYMVSVISILRLAWRDTRGGWEHEFELVPQIPDHDYSLDAIKHSNEAEHYDKAASKTLIEISEYLREVTGKVYTYDNEEEQRAMFDALRDIPPPPPPPDPPPAPAKYIPLYHLSIQTGAGMVDVISSYNKSVIDRLVDAIGRGKKDSKGQSFTVVQKDGDYIVNNNRIDNVDLSQHTHFNIDNAKHYYKTENHGFTAAQVQTIVDSLVPSIQSLESAIEAHKAQSAESSAEVAELASVLNEIKDSLAKAPSTEAEKTRAKDLVSKFKDRVDDCSRLNAIYTLGSGAIETFQKILIGGVLA